MAPVLSALFHHLEREFDGRPTMLILDEAHNVEDAATAHLGVEVTRRGLEPVTSLVLDDVAAEWPDAADSAFAGASAIVTTGECGECRLPETPRGKAEV